MQERYTNEKDIRKRLHEAGTISIRINRLLSDQSEQYLSSKAPTPSTQHKTTPLRFKDISREQWLQFHGTLAKSLFQPPDKGVRNGVLTTNGTSCSWYPRKTQPKCLLLPFHKKVIWVYTGIDKRWIPQDSSLHIIAVDPGHAVLIDVHNLLCTDN